MIENSLSEFVVDVVNERVPQETRQLEIYKADNLDGPWSASAIKDAGTPSRLIHWEPIELIADGPHRVKVVLRKQQQVVVQAREAGYYYCLYNFNGFYVPTRDMPEAVWTEADENIMISGE